MQIKDPVPEIMRLEQLALQIKEGAIRLPRFQRPFVWQRSDMLKLLDSIYKGYPIGSVLIWNSSQRLNSEKNIAGITVNLADFFLLSDQLSIGRPAAVNDPLRSALLGWCW
ncbi:MAG: DUF262 domain-containing protein [Cellvibrionaceae bacterium]|nr:DUF262 domain-containing protein [Cellvibrionaceae bacterium]